MVRSIISKKRTGSGFTIVELMVVMSILGVLTAIAIPGFSRWLPNYRLKTSAQDLYSGLQSTRLLAIRQNTATGVSFYAGPDQYRYTVSGVDRTVDLSSYKYGTRFDGPSGETFDVDYLVFDVRGFSNGGFAYLSNAHSSGYYRVGALTTGVVQLQKWNGAVWE